MNVTARQIPKPADVLALARAARRLAEPVVGELAAVLAGLIHEAGLDTPCQVGRARFFCRNDECLAVRDCTDPDELDIAFILAGGVTCDECGMPFVVEDLRLCEWWVERL